MKLVTFKSISIRNFLSVGHDPVTVDFQPGLNVITGINKDKEDRRNGVGKSTIADAINFALYGSTIRELKKEHIINNITQTGCEVVLVFSINENNSTDVYKISRQLKPTKCFIYKNDIDVTRDSISNTTQYIIKLINSSPEVFQSCVIMTVNNTTPFMAKKKIDKRKFIEGILNLEVFSDMLTDARNEFNTASKDFDVECMRYEEVSNSIENHELQLINHKKQVEANTKSLHDNKTANHRNRIRILEQIEELEKAVTSGLGDDIKLKQDQLEKCMKKIVDSRDVITRLGTEIEYKKKELNALDSTSTICPTCLRDIQEDDRDHIDIERNKISKSLTHVQGEYESAHIPRDDLIKLKDLLDNKIKDLRTTQQEQQSRALKVESLTRELKAIDDMISRLDDLLESEDTVGRELVRATKASIDRLRDTQLRIDDLKAELNRLDVIKFIVSEEGVKSYIVKKILQVLNNKIAYYLKKMDANCICVFNEYFEEQVFDEKGKICSYFNFSGAEKKNIDLACLFAFMDIRRLQGDVVFNFNVYDELLDSSLDRKGIELVLSILKERVLKYNEMVYIISHRKESATFVGHGSHSPTGEVIYLQKQKGITTRVAPVDSKD